jgi:hypothetical protein
MERKERTTIYYLTFFKKISIINLIVIGSIMNFYFIQLLNVNLFFIFRKTKGIEYYE